MTLLTRDIIAKIATSEISVVLIFALARFAAVSWPCNGRSFYINQVISAEMTRLVADTNAQDRPILDYYNFEGSTQNCFLKKFLHQLGFADGHYDLVRMYVLRGLLRDVF